MKTWIKYPSIKETKSLVVCGVLALVAALPAMAQETDTYTLQVGDTITIKPGTKAYLTGEKPSKWVYNYRHVIQQVGGIRFPDGILLRGIYSWMAPENLQFVARQDTVKPVFMESEDEAAESASKQALIEKETSGQTEELNTILPNESLWRMKQKQEKNVSETQAESDSTVVEGLPETEEAQEEVKTDNNRMMSHHRFSVGVRGGVASLMHETDVMGNWRAGFDGLLDLQYAYYAGRKDGKKVNLGVITGVSLGWAQSGLRSGVDTAYTVATSDGNIDYTVSAKQVDEKDGQLQVEIPVMFSLLTENGFFFNVGPKVVLPVYRHFNQSIATPDINAYFPEEGVNVSNEVITGKVTDDQLKTKGKWNGSKLNLMLTAELGYEWALRNGGALGLGAYANYSVYDLYKNDTSNKSLINVAAPSSAAPATVDILSATDTYAKGLGYFDCGVKLVYHFQFLKK